MTLKQLREQVTATPSGKLPTYSSITQQNKNVILFYQEIENKLIHQDDMAIKEMPTVKSELTVYKDGYVTYKRNDSNRTTVFAINQMKWLYRFVDTQKPKIIPESEYDFMEAIDVLTLYAEDRLSHNSDSRAEYWTEFHPDNDGTDFSHELTVPDFTDDLFDIPEQALTTQRLHDAISQLTDKQRQVIAMTYFHDMTQQAIADKLGISRNSVEDRLHGALKKLKKIF